MKIPHTIKAKKKSENYIKNNKNHNGVGGKVVTVIVMAINNNNNSQRLLATSTVSVSRLGADATRGRILSSAPPQILNFPKRLFGKDYITLNKNNE